MPLADVQKRVHVAEVAVKMDGNDRPCAPRNRRLYLGWVDAPAVGQDVHKNRLGAKVRDGCGRGNPVDITEYDFVPRAHSECGEPHVYCASTAARCNRVLYAEVSSEISF